MRNIITLFCLFAVGMQFATIAWSVEDTVARPKKIFAHYMGCWPVAHGALPYSKLQDAKTLRHDSTNNVMRHGGHVRNWDLVPWGTNLTREQSADLEIRRAMRIGIDGFAVDAWAGGDSARQTLDALFKVAEEKNYSFELTVCIDPTCGGNIVTTVKELLDKHGDSPKLARRDGKPLIFGYQSAWPGLEYMKKMLPGKSDKELQQLRVSPAGWELMGQAFDDAARQLGRPIYWHFCLSAFFYGVDRTLIPTDGYAKVAGILAKHVQAVGDFTRPGADESDIARAVVAAGAEWSTPLGMFQKENIPYELHGGKGLDWMVSNWEAVRKQHARLVQLVTWNDYGENSNIAPAYNTRYTLYDLTAYFIKWWKYGTPPTPDHDAIYLVSRKYPRDAKVFPFAQGPYIDGALEVVTLLTKPATIRLPGRQAEYQAPAGFFRAQFPVTPGPVSAELLRGGKVVLTLAHPEPITDRPFREDNAMTCYSTEFMRHWKADFADAKPLLWSEYGDATGDGLPNWFKMYWFGKFGDMSSATVADPQAITPCGKTLRQAYLEQKDPTTKPIPYEELPQTGLLAWYRADKDLLVDEKGCISAWQDQSGHKLDLLATAERYQPRRLDNYWNALPVVALDGIQNSFLCRLPDAPHTSMTVIAVAAARASEQICRIQQGENNRLISIPTTTKQDCDGGISLGVGRISYPKGDVGVVNKTFPPGEHPAYIGIGFMVNNAQLNFRTWNFTGKVAEILIYSPALSAQDAQKIVSILKNRYNL